MRTPRSSRATLILLVLVVAPFLLTAQERTWGDVHGTDLSWNTFENDPDAKAVILQDVGFVYFNTELNLEFERHIRIKILDPDNTDLTDVSIYFNPARRNERVTNLQAQVFNLNEQGDVVRTRLGRRDFHEERIRDNLHVRKFTFPNLQEGSIVEYRYRITSRNATFLRDWYFQSEEPTLYSSLTTHLTSIYQYAQIVNGNPMLFSVNERELYSPGSAVAAGSYQGTGGQTSRWVAQNMGAVRREPHMTTPNDYKLSVRFQLATVLPPGGLPRPVLENWEVLSDELLRHVSLGRQISANRAIRNAVQELTEGIDNDMDKARALYTYVSRNINWNRRIGVFSNEGVRTAFDKQSGSGADKSLLLITMLREAGMEAHPVLISTRNNGRPIWDYPIVTQFNYMVVLVHIGDGAYVLDPTYRDLPFGVLHPNSLNDEGYILRQGDLATINLPITQAQRNRHLGLLSIDADGRITGTMSAAYAGYDAILTRALLRGDNREAALQEIFLSKLSDAELSETEVNELDNPDVPVTITAEVTAENYIMIAGDRMYFNPFIQQRFDDNPFRMTNRSFPVELNYGFENQIVATYRLPEGYEVEELPRNLEIAFTPETYYRQIFRVDSNGLQLVSTLKMGDTYIPVEYYRQLRDFYNQIVDAQSGQIVLRRISDETESQGGQ